MSTTLLNNRPHIFTAKEIGFLGDFIKLHDEWIHQINIVTDKGDEFEFDFISNRSNPDMKAILDKLFPRITNPGLKSKFKGGRIRSIEIAESHPVTVFKAYVEKEGAKQ